MEEYGRVVSVDGDRAHVEVAAGKACESCAASAMCNWTGERTRSLLTRNVAGAVVGDRVKVRTEDSGRSRSAFLVFGLPALLMAGGVLVGSLLWNNAGAAIAGGAGLLLALLLLRVLDRAAARSGRRLPMVVEVCSLREPGAE